MLNSATRPTLVVRDGGKVRLERVSVALDLSQHSAQVLRQAVGMALLLEAPLEVLVVVPTLESFDVDGILGGVHKVDKRNLRRQAQRAVDKRLGQFMEDMEVPFPWREKLAAMERRHTLLWGDPVGELASHCAEEDNHLLVLGTRGERRAELARQVGRTASSVAANLSSHLLFVP
jgi:nucleotide-binding universal stress UspA family protein